MCYVIIEFSYFPWIRFVDWLALFYITRNPEQIVKPTKDGSLTKYDNVEMQPLSAFD